MKSKYLLLLTLTAALSFFGASCKSSAENTASTANRGSAVNANATNGGSAANAGGAGARENASTPTISGDLMETAPNAASQPYDLQFIDSLSAHHQSATSMAALVLTNSNRPELKQFAQKIIDDQKKEISQMKEWREKWFPSAPSALNMELPGMMSSMKGMDMGKLKTAKGEEFDLMFLDAMTRHHSGAVTVAKDALTKSERPEIKTLAQNVIKAQEAEIKQMSEWKSQWSK